MATRTARRGLGARAILAGTALLAIVAMTLPASADDNVLVATSVDRGWATLTKEEPFPSGGRTYDPLDPPYQRADGPVEFVLARFQFSVCDENVAVVDRKGAAVAGTLAVENHGLEPRRVLRFTFAEPLKYTRSPYTATFTAGKFHGTDPDTLLPICHNPQSYSRTFGIDRFFAEVPSITKPAGLALSSRGGGGICRNVPSGPGQDECYKRLRTAGEFDPIIVALNPDSDSTQPGQQVVFAGKASDPLTYPEFDRGETSGISRVRLNLFQGAITSSGRKLIKTYYQANNCDTTVSHPIDGTVLPACDRTLDFSFDLTADLVAGNDYAVEIAALDRAGDPLTNDLTAERRSGETKSIAFVFTG